MTVQRATRTRLRSAMPISTRSVWSDSTWFLDGMRPGLPDGIMTINWRLPFNDGTDLLDLQYVDLLETCRQFIWSYRTNPPNGRGRHALTTMKTTWYSLRPLLLFMHKHRVRRFHDLTPDHISEYVEVLRQRPGRRGRPITANSIQKFFQVLVDLYLQRKIVGDGLQRHPFLGESAYHVAGPIAPIKSYPHMPEEIAIPLITSASKCLDLGGSVLSGVAKFDALKQTAIGEGWAVRSAEIRAQTLLEARSPAIRKLFAMSQHISFTAKANDIYALLIDACFIIIAAFTGMRAGELLSIEEGAVFSVRHSNGKRYWYVQARSYKTEGEINGTILRWIAPDIVVKAIRLLERLTATARKVSNKKHLFLAPSGRAKGQYTILTRNVLEDRIAAFCRRFNVPVKHRGKPWAVTVHQFRKTFARFVGARDRSSLNALSRHYKHTSIAMTDKGYVGNDFELAEMIESETERQIVTDVSAVLAPAKRGGKLGNRLNDAPPFQGRVGTQVRADFAKFILQESQAGIYAAPYGYCVFQLDTALCGGDGSKRGIPTCLKCANFVVTPDQRPYWEAQRDENTELLTLTGIEPIVRAVIEERIAEAQGVLDQITSAEEASA